MTQENLEPTSAANGQPAPAAQFQLRFERFSAFVEEYTSTISLEGMFLKTREPRPVGTVVAFDIRLADGFQLIHGQGEVEWMRPDGQGPEQPGGMGIRFQTLSDKGRELILKILDEHLKVGGQPFEISDVPQGGVSLPGQGGAGAALGGLDFDAPWGAKLPDVPSEFLDEADSPSVVPGAVGFKVSEAPLSPSAEQAPSPPMDDVFALPEENATATSQDDVFAAPLDDSFAPPLEEDVSVGTEDGAFDLEAVPEFDSEVGDDIAEDGLGEFGDQPSLPGLEPLAGTGSEVSSQSAEAADWEIQPTTGLDEEPTLLGAGGDESTLLGDDEPTLVSLQSAGAAAPPPTEDSPLPEDLPALGEEDGGAGVSNSFEVVEENPFVAETFPEAGPESADFVAPMPQQGEAVPAAEPGLEELGDSKEDSWGSPDPTPTFATDAVPTDPFATDSLEAGAYPVDPVGQDPFATDSIAAPDSFAVPGFSPVDTGASSEFQPFEPSTDLDSSASGVVEGGLVGPFQFEEYDLDKASHGSGTVGALKRLRKPLLGLAAVAVLIAVVIIVRQPVLNLLGGEESAEPIVSRIEVPLAEPIPQEISDPQVGIGTPGEREGEESASSVVEGVNPESEESESTSESPLPVSSSPASPAPSETAAEEISLPLESSLKLAEAAPPHASPPRRDTLSEPPASLAMAERVMDVSTRRERGGTLVILTLDGVVDPGSVVVDAMAWDPDSEKLVLSGIREPYHPQTLKIHSAELSEVRTGFHSGSELWVVFDFTSTNLRLEPPQIDNNRIEILIRQR